MGAFSRLCRPLANIIANVRCAEYHPTRGLVFSVRSRSALEGSHVIFPGWPIDSYSTTLLTLPLSLFYRYRRRLRPLFLHRNLCLPYLSSRKQLPRGPPLPVYSGEPPRLTQYVLI